MPTRALDVILAALALLGPFAIHLFFPVIPVVKVDFELSDASAQLIFTCNEESLRPLTRNSSESSVSHCPNRRARMSGAPPGAGGGD